jgi:protein-tyrosine phosphatase
MLAVAADSGTADIVATPHANSKFAFHRELVLQRMAVLAQATGGHPRIHFGCEFHLTFDNVDHLMQNPRKYTVNEKQYLLVECPDFHIGPHVEKLLCDLVGAGIVPMIAHPERNPLLSKKLSHVEGWVEQGCLLQVTALSLTGGFGRAARIASRRLLDRGLVHLIASDAHDPLKRPPGLAEARQAVRSGWGEEVAEILFTENPRAVVEGTPIPGGKQIGWRRAADWYQLWKRSV